MKKEDINLFIDTMKIVMFYDIEKLFKKTELESGTAGEDDAVYKRKYNKNIEIIETAISKDDDTTELLLLCLKSTMSNINPAKEDLSKIKYIYSVTGDEADAKVYLFVTKFKNVLESYTPNESDLKYVLGFMNITIEED